jgi:hypothetical protein
MAIPTTLMGALGFLLPHYSIWPQPFLDGITYLLSSLAIINFIFPIDAVFYGGNVFFTFLALYYGAKLLSSIFNYFRGAGGIKT